MNNVIASGEFNVKCCLQAASLITAVFHAHVDNWMLHLG